METGGASPNLVSVQFSQGPDGPKLTFSIVDRTSVVPLQRILPALRSLTDAVTEAAAVRERAAGRAVSCKSGCAACCRHLVCLSLTEARQLPELFDALEPDHRGRVMARMADTLSKLRGSTIWTRLESFSKLSRQEQMALGIDYMRLGIPCPFLENEQCSIYPVRPLVCRQFLVNSPAVHCADPTGGNVTRVPLAVNVLDAVEHIEAPESGKPGLLPMILTLSMTPVVDETRETAPGWVRRLLARIKQRREKQIAAMGSPAAPNNEPKCVAANPG